MRTALTVFLLLLTLPALAQEDPAPGAGIAQRLGAAPITSQVQGDPEVRKPKLRAEHSVVIEAPIGVVWRYASDSTLAHQWSVYFDHITPLEGGDGGVGALRRCFVKADESGKRWDERVVGIDVHRVRRIDMFNMHGYKVPGSRKWHYDVWQLYEPLSPTQTRLTFRSAPAQGAGLVQWAFWFRARQVTDDVFQKNLENIKAAIEQGQAYQRVHPYAPGD